MIYTIFIYVICNFINFDKFLRWFYLNDQFDYFGFFAFLILGFCLCFFVFLLLFLRWLIKPLAIFFIILSAASAYFIKKYDVAIDHSMVINVFHTNFDEVNSLLSLHMWSYILFLIIFPVFLIVFTKITFQKYYFFSSLRLSVLSLILGIIFLYTKFDSISRAFNLSQGYISYYLIPINYIRGFADVIGDLYVSHFPKRQKKNKIFSQVISNENLVVVLAIGETSRQRSFNLYNYKRDTNPLLSRDKELHILNGKTRIGSTVYALRDILSKKGVSLPFLTSQLGIDTACYVNYTLDDNCIVPGEKHVSNCGHNGRCYDEDVVPLLSQNLQSYKSGTRFIVLHLGGGSHGPSYYTRYPKEFQKFTPMCSNPDVINHCSVQELFNAYDNSIIYVDYVLNKIISELEQSKVPYVFIYLSDHGESLMENGHIFHGMPPGISLPSEQADIPLIVKSSVPIKIKQRSAYRQIDIFDTVLNLMSIETSISNKELCFIEREKK